VNLPAAAAARPGISDSGATWLLRRPGGSPAVAWTPGDPPIGSVCQPAAHTMGLSK